MYDSVEAMWLGGRFGVLDLIKSQPIQCYANQVFLIDNFFGKISSAMFFSKKGKPNSFS